MLSPRARRRTLELLLDQAIRLSFPLYTYPEMRELVRSRFYLFYERLRERGARREALSRLADLTPQGMRNLGGARPPSISGARGERVILLWLEGAGPEGLPFVDIAERYEARRPRADASLEEALWELCSEGRAVRLPGGRYAAAHPPAGEPHPALSAEGRELLLLLHAAPEQSMTAAALEAALQERGAALEPPLLAQLQAAGEIQLEGDRVSLCGAPSERHHTLHEPHEAILDTLLGFGVGAVHAVREQAGEGPALATGWCLRLPADPEARWALLARLREQVAALTAALEEDARQHGGELTTTEILLTASAQEP